MGITRTSFKKGHKALTGSDHPAWKGDNISYQRKHQWVRYWFGDANACEHCQTTTAKRYEWANISGEYKRAREDYKQLCKSCHAKYDNIGEKVWKTRRAYEI